MHPRTPRPLPLDPATTRIVADAPPSAPALLLRPWEPSDVPELALICRDDPVLRHWTSTGVHDHASAARWIEARRRGWEAGDRFAFAVEESRPARAGGRLLGDVVLKRGTTPGPSAEVGYWTAARARGRGVAPRALRSLTRWAFSTFGDAGLSALELLHQVDNTASCRVARKCGYELTGLRPASPPAYPLDGHVHRREYAPPTS
ncbi:acetyltransferase [Streptomyces longispororuber]|uniref:Acetyltransferase n=1 Tax=Streptomyces longispororuber TaxID=68230 RepID=A0A919DEU4_9ACTN|nr:GNAT family N-acetyltransferase [Streptomyces longispororuber]GHE41635.1 acetyltransferase [Streptomyces longispororuber]